MAAAHESLAEILPETAMTSHRIPLRYQLRGFRLGINTVSLL